MDDVVMIRDHRGSDGFSLEDDMIMQDDAMYYSEDMELIHRVFLRLDEHGRATVMRTVLQNLQFFNNATNHDVVFTAYE